MNEPATPNRRLDAREVTALLDEHFPHVHDGSGRIEIEWVRDGTAALRMRDDPRMLRPGGTVSGPMMFKLADLGVYVLVLSELGSGALQAVTTSITINFMSRPRPGDIFAEARLLKLGRRLAVAEVAIRSDGDSQLVAHATATYALPTTR